MGKRGVDAQYELVREESVAYLERVSAQQQWTGKEAAPQKGTRERHGHIPTSPRHVQPRAVGAAMNPMGSKRNRFAEPDDA